MRRPSFGLVAPLALLAAVPAWGALKYQTFAQSIDGAPVVAFAVSDDGKGATRWSALPTGIYSNPGLSLPELAAQHETTVAVNANFYREDVPGFQDPIGLVLHEGRVLALSNRFYPTAGFIDGKFEWDHVRVEAVVEVESRGKKLRRNICRMNLRASGECVSLWQKAPAEAPALLPLGADFQGLVAGKHEYETSKKSANASGPALQWPGKLPPGLASKISIEVVLTGERLGARWQKAQEAVSGSHVLTVERTSPALTRAWTTARQPRTLVGADAQGRPWVAVFDGRRPESRGVSVTDAWSIVHKKLNAAWALNLDGGGSTTMIFQGRLVNMPSDGYPRNIAVGLGAKAKD